MEFYLGRGNKMRKIFKSKKHNYSYTALCAGCDWCAGYNDQYTVKQINATAKKHTIETGHKVAIEDKNILYISSTGWTEE
jgi:hypothetical protein